MANVTNFEFTFSLITINRRKKMMFWNQCHHIEKKYASDNFYYYTISMVSIFAFVNWFICVIFSSQFCEHSRPTTNSYILVCRRSKGAMTTKHWSASIRTTCGWILVEYWANFYYNTVMTHDSVRPNSRCVNIIVTCLCFVGNFEKKRKIKINFSLFVFINFYKLSILSTLINK